MHLPMHTRIESMLAVVNTLRTHLLSLKLYVTGVLEFDPPRDATRTLPCTDGRRNQTVRALLLDSQSSLEYIGLQRIRKSGPGGVTAYTVF